MHLYDIRKKLLLENNDSDSIIYLCSVDKLSQSIYKSKSFWEDIYELNNLKFTTYYDNLKNNILEYKMQGNV